MAARSSFYPVNRACVRPAIHCHVGQQRGRNKKKKNDVPSSAYRQSRGEQEDFSAGSTSASTPDYRSRNSTVVDYFFQYFLHLHLWTMGEESRTATHRPVPNSISSPELVSRTLAILIKFKLVTASFGETNRFLCCRARETRSFRINSQSGSPMLTRHCKVTNCLPCCSYVGL